MADVAFLGLGRMGAPMASNLAAAGHRVVLHNRTTTTAEDLAAEIGAEVAATPRAAAAAAPVVITMLADESALRAVHHGEDGILAGLRADGIVVDMGTTGPAGIRRLAPEVAAAGGVLLDAPVSGSTDAARSAGLTILVGGPDDAVATVRPLLEAMGERLYHLGDTGAGSVTKLAVNNIIYALGTAVSESLVLAERAGLDRAQVYDVLEHSAVAAPMIHYRHDAFLDPEGTPAAFALTLAQKDLRLIVALAERLGVAVDQARAGLDVVTAAVEAGLGEHDMADVAVHLRNS
jgi:3-hydroxyisobutyrate dehydrogenase-like beta-hydroxyacid dehydrogenase